MSRTLEVQDVSFDGNEAQITVTTPEGGLSGASCGDLNDGAEAVFVKVYNEAGWNGGAAVIFKGGLVDTSTGQAVPDVNTGIFTMPAAQASQIDWGNEDVSSISTGTTTATSAIRHCSSPAPSTKRRRCSNRYLAAAFRRS